MVAMFDGVQPEAMKRELCTLTRDTPYKKWGQKFNLITKDCQKFKFKVNEIHMSPQAEPHQTSHRLFSWLIIGSRYIHIPLW
jgi:hypothetical protein